MIFLSYTSMFRKYLGNRCEIFTIVIVVIILILASCHQGDQIYDTAPAADRFVLADLVANLNEPMELDFLNKQKIIFIERNGLVKTFDLDTRISQVIGEIPTSVVAESGLLGVAVDPNYAANQWVYFFYTDFERKSYHNISRFKVRNDSLINETEQLLLDFPYDYLKCCHNGGALDFGPDGLLYISTGDNMGGTDYGPIDERPGELLNDAQKTSANSMDYRGKILRIKPEDDGSYSIPNGNLFDPDDPEALPEIYIMGVRNPWKIHVDQKTGWLHWGEVGPNPGIRDPSRGPDAQEELNLAKKAGNFGWPYMVGDNKPYADYDFARDEIGEFFKADSLINDSPNNTGKNVLPSAQKATIWYPNTLSDTFPLLGIGGGSAVGGPIYHVESHSGHENRFPDYYENHWFIGDWMRGWIFAAKLDRDGRYLDMYPFLDDQPFKKPIDMEFGPDGALYVLDYGSNWYVQNKDAKLTRISYNYGNRPPKAILSADHTHGATPLTVNFEGHSFDPDNNDALQFRWLVNNEVVHSGEETFEYTFSQSGGYNVSLVAVDPQGLADTATVEIIAGNAPPEINLAFNGNQSFYDSNRKSFLIDISDKEDSESGRDLMGFAKIDFRELSRNIDLGLVRATSAIKDPSFDHLNGRTLLEGSDCYACHAMSDPSVGPSFLEIQERYIDNPRALSYLTQKIRDGGVGAWGAKLMSAHPQHSDEEIEEMVKYILSLNAEIALKTPKTKNVLDISSPGAFYKLSIGYEDGGGKGVEAIYIEDYRILRPYRVHATSYEDSYRVVPKPYNEEGDMFAEIMINGSYIGFRDIDLSNIHAVQIRMRGSTEWIQVDVAQDHPDNTPIGSKRVAIPSVENRWVLTNDHWFELTIPIEGENGLKDLYFIVNSDRTEGDVISYEICQMEWIEFLKRN